MILLLEARSWFAMRASLPSESFGFGSSPPLALLMLGRAEAAWSIDFMFKLPFLFLINAVQRTLRGLAGLFTSSTCPMLVYAYFLHYLYALRLRA